MFERIVVCLPLTVFLLPGRCWKKVGKAQLNQAVFMSQLHTSPDSPFRLGSSIGQYRVLVQTERPF
jgi:hypothetical protein